jgi:hypothetical protein
VPGRLAAAVGRLRPRGRLPKGGLQKAPGSRESRLVTYLPFPPFQEVRCRLAAEVMTGQPIISIDNLNGDMGKLAQSP